MATSPTPPTGAPSRNGPSNPFLRFLDRVFLWLPNDRSPGILAVCLFLLRQVTLPFVLMLTPFVVLALMARSNFNPLNMSTAPNWFTLSAAPLAFGSVALVQELGRYSFVRHADRPLRALCIFTGVIVACVILFMHDHLYTCAWMITAQLAASAAIFYGIRHRTYIHAVIFAIVICQTTVDVTAPRFFLPPEAASRGAQNPPAGANRNAPSAGNMKSWAKLYPGATVTSSETRNFFGLTSWRVDYTVHASPERIGAFYEALANQEGFTDRQTLGAYHRFTQDSTNNDFSYFLASDAAGTEVIFQARTSGGAGPGG